MNRNYDSFSQPWMMPQIVPYHDMNPDFQNYSDYPSPPVDYSHTIHDSHDIPNSSMQHWQPLTYCKEEQPPPSPYSGQAPSHHCVGSLSPEMGWGRSYPSLPEDLSHSRSISRAPSFISTASSWTSNGAHSCSSTSDASRAESPNSDKLTKWGKLQEGGKWTCAYPNCTSIAKFNRGCDLRKHYRRHTKSFFCRSPGCPQNANKGSGFSSEKDRTRHEAKHNPKIQCERKDCTRIFSRVDNMRDHVNRIHNRKPRK